MKASVKFFNIYEYKNLRIAFRILNFVFFEVTHRRIGEAEHSMETDRPWISNLPIKLKS